MISELEMQWTIRGPGWARLTWAADHDVVEMATSYLGDGLRSLLTAAIDLQNGASATFAGLSGEPAGYVLLFGGATEDVYVQIVHLPRYETEGDPWQGAQRRWVGRVPVQMLVGAVTKMAEAVLAEHGLDGYKNLWGGTSFPSTELDSLQRGIAESRPTS